MHLSLRARFGLVALAAFGLTAAGLLIGEVMNLQPCPLCIFQRLLYLLIGCLAVVGALLPRLGTPVGGAAWPDRGGRAGDCRLPELAAVFSHGEHGVRFW